MPIKRQSHKMVKHTQKIRRKKPTNCLSVFDHFVGLVLKGLRCSDKAWWVNIAVTDFITSEMRITFSENRKSEKIAASLKGWRSNPDFLSKILILFLQNINLLRTFKKFFCSKLPLFLTAPSATFLVNLGKLGKPRGAEVGLIRRI